MDSTNEEEQLLGISISLPIPANDPSLFSSKATNDLLLFLSRHRFDEFTINRLADRLDYTSNTISRAVDDLENNDLVQVHHEGNRRLVSINRERLTMPDDPIMRIPQVEYHEPTRKAVKELTAEVPNLVAIILYGSVARGEADRQSDIDLWLLVTENRAAAQRTATTVAQQLEDERFNATNERFDFHIDVESVRSIPQYTEDISRIINAGIPVFSTDEFEQATRIIDNLAAEQSNE
jgi:predicted nucleotidyltransferase